MGISLKKTLAAVVTGALIASTLAMPISAKETAGKEYMNVGYAFRRGLVIEELDLSKVTHLNYSFGLIYNREVPPDPKAELNPDCATPENFDDALLHTIYLPEDAKSDLKKLPALKAAKNPDLKVMLSVGGYNARGFSDLASTEAGRKAFAKSCKAVIDEYQLAGIDLDWEYPTIDWANIKVRPEDPQNFTLLLQEVRNAIGKDKLLSIAGSANLNFTETWTEFDKIMPILDYINIMTYDFQYGTCYYGSALYASKKWPTA
ncbi:MAG: glycosyl hydrolase family 18 protein, partial [Oscillospiraceae bacterium]